MCPRTLKTPWGSLERTNQTEKSNGVLEETHDAHGKLAENYGNGKVSNEDQTGHSINVGNDLKRSVDDCSVPFHFMRDSRSTNCRSTQWIEPENICLGNQGVFEACDSPEQPCSDKELASSGQSPSIKSKIPIRCLDRNKSKFSGGGITKRRSISKRGPDIGLVSTKKFQVVKGSFYCKHNRGGAVKKTADVKSSDRTKTSVLGLGRKKKASNLTFVQRKYFGKFRLFLYKPK